MNIRAIKKDENNNEALEKLKRCLICTYLFDQHIYKPFSIFKCGHTFCKVCLNNTAIKKCPSCRQTIEYKVKNWLCLDMVTYLKMIIQLKFLFLYL